MVSRYTVHCFYDKKPYTIIPQVYTMGCGPYAVGIAKEYLLGAHLDDAQWDLLIETFDIDNSGTDVEQLIELLGQAPATEYNLRSMNKTALMRAARPDRPVIVSWLFDRPYGGIGGHFNVCLGPTQTSPNNLVIIDSAFGLNYVTVPANPEEDDDKTLVFEPVRDMDGDNQTTRVPAANAHLDNVHVAKHQSSNIECWRGADDF